MTNPLLLASSVVFEDADLIDCIRQSCIDLNQESDYELIEILIDNSIEYLTKDITFDVANEIIEMLRKCFTYYPDDPLPQLAKLYDKSKTNANFLVSFCSVLSVLTNDKKGVDLSSYSAFVDEALDEIIPQLKNLNELTIFKQKIHFQFRADIIIDLLLSTKLTEDRLTIFTPFLFSEDVQNCEKFVKLRKKIANSDLAGRFLILALNYDSSEQSNEDDQKEFKEEIVLEKVDDEIISSFLSSKNPEEDEKLNKSLIEHFLSEKSNLMAYLQVIFENLQGAAFDPEEILSYFNDEYTKYKDDFIKILNNVLVLHPTQKVFVKQPEYKPLDFKNSEFNTNIINKLFKIVEKDPSNFNAYYCLRCIASSFPFIFSSNPQQVIDAVLPAFDNYKLLFQNKIKGEGESIEQKNQMNSKKAKAAVAAVSFLIFSLNSTKVIDFFVPWFFKNHKNLTLSQLYCVLIVFCQLSSTHFYDLLLSYLIRFDFYKVFSEILLREVPKGLFGENFNKVLYLFLIVQHSFGQVVTTLDMISIDIEIENVFYEKLCHRITNSISYIPQADDRVLYVTREDINRLNSEPLDFYMMNEKAVPSYKESGRTKHDKVTQEQVNDFINHYYSLIQKATKDEKDLDFPGLPEKMTLEMASLMSKGESWINRYMLGEKFPLLTEHREILDQRYSEILALKNDDIDDDDASLVKNFSFKKHFNFYREDQTFIKNLISRMATNVVPSLLELMRYVKLISIYPKDYELIFTTFSENFKIISEKYPISSNSTEKRIKYNFMIMDQMVEGHLKSDDVDKSELNEAFNKYVANDLINLVLKPQFRCDNILIKLNYSLLKMFKEYPKRVLHVIGFMIRSGDNELQEDATQLSLNVDEDQLKSLNILEDFFNHEIAKDKPRTFIISNILRSAPFIGKANSESLREILEIQLEKCQKEEKDKKEEEEEEEKDDEDDDKKIKTKEFVIQLLDFLAPERNSDFSFSMSDSLIASKRQQQSPEFRFCPIPDYIYNKDQEFWSIFERYRPFINSILLKEYQSNPVLEPTGFIAYILSLLIDIFSSRLVSNYPECFSFEFRTVFFRQMVHDSIDFLSTVEIEVDKDSIFEDSYNQLVDKEKDEWLSRFDISYKGDQDVVNAGGVTKDWFTRLSQAIFNPKSELFEMSEKNGNFMPRRSKYAESEEGLKKLKFVGMIVARALVGGTVIDAHLAKPFLKQILHHPEKIYFNDLQDVDEDWYNSLSYWLKFDFEAHPDEEIMFEKNTEDGEIIELIENGKNIRVNNDNKEKYVQLMSEYRMKKSVAKQTEAFCSGFDIILPHKKIRMFTPSELDLVICGVPKIDIDDLMKNMEYEEPLTADSPVVKLFFSSIRKWDDESLAKLLIFWTGSSRIPSGGFEFYKQMGRSIKIQTGGESDRLPASHTCANTLDLPEYKTEDELNAKFLTAINVDYFQNK